MIIALINSKGGVAKTTTTVNLGTALAQAGRRVLICDLDSQASASFSLGVARGDLEPSLAQALLEDAPLSGLIRATAHPKLDLVTGSMALANVDLVLSDVAGREKKLAQILEPVARRYDFVLLDCPPSLSLLPINALVVAERYIVPVTPHYLALEGLVNLSMAVEKLKAGIGGASMLGIVLTQVDYRAKMTGEIAAMIRGQFGDQVFASEIRNNIKITEAPSFGQSVLTYAPSSPGANAYRFLAGEVLGRIQKGRPPPSAPSKATTKANANAPKFSQKEGIKDGKK